MILIKCKCGCFYTLAEKGLEAEKHLCPNCKSKHDFDSSTSILSMALASIDKDGFEAKQIPDDAKITVTYDMQSYSESDLLSLA